MTQITEQPDEDPLKSMVLGKIRARKATTRTVAEQLSEALQRKLQHQLSLAKELVHIDEELAAKALEVIENAEGAAQWLTRVLPILDNERTPLELSRTPEGKAACLQALGRLDHGVFG